MITEFLTVVVLSVWIVKPVNTSGSNTIGVSTSCFPTYIQISLLRESFPGVNLSALYLRSPWCKPSKNLTHVTFKAPLYGCKTHLVKTDDYYAFDNVVQGVSPSIEVRCFYNNEHHSGSGDTGKWHYSIKITAQLNLYRDSKLSRPVPPGEAIKFELPKPRDLIFDLRIIPNQKDVRVCLFVKFCGLFFKDKVLSLIENGQENKMTTRLLFTSPQRITFRFNASTLVTSMNLNKLKAFCTVNGYHERKAQNVITNNVKKDCNGSHDDKHHGNASDCQESKEGPDSMEFSRNSTHCNCEQKGLPEANGKVNQTRGGCGGSCVNGSKVYNGTSYTSRDRNLRRKREVKDQGLLGIVSRENNNTSFDLKQNNGSSNNQETISNYISKDKHGCDCREQCSSAAWNGKPVSLLLEREWTANPSIPKRDLKLFEKYDARHVPQTIKNGVNSTLAQAVGSREERISSPALLLACSYLSLLLVIGPVLLVYLWDRRNQKKRRRHKHRI